MYEKLKTKNRKNKSNIKYLIAKHLLMKRFLFNDK